MAKNKFDDNSLTIEVHITPEIRKILDEVDTRFITKSYYICQAIEQSASSKKLKDLRISTGKETKKEEENKDEKEGEKES